jgi:hypothetical protein
LPLWVLLAVAGPLSSAHAPSADLGWLVWPLALVWHLLLLRGQSSLVQARRAEAAARDRLLALPAAGGARSAVLDAAVGRAGSAWPTLGWMLVPAIVLMLITRPAVLRLWPLSEFRSTYLGGACAPLALYLLLWLWVGNTGRATRRRCPTCRC